jgi:hypothetical protein
MTIAVDMIDAVKVQFVKPIFEDDFVERGMKAWLTAVEWDTKTGCYQLFFDFTEFEGENAKYFKRIFYPNIHTAKLTEEQLQGRNGSIGYNQQNNLFTAHEAGHYQAKYSVYFNTVDDPDVRDDAAFANDITKYLREIE